MSRVEGMEVAQQRWPEWWSSSAGTAMLLLGFVVLARLISFHPSMINPDESIFALCAREMLHGYLPYTRVFDNKPIGLTVLLAVVFRMVGMSILTVRLVGATCVWASAILLATLGRQGGLSRLQALCCGLLYIAYASTMGGFATLTEIILAPFTISAVLLLRRAVATEQFVVRSTLFAGAGLACGCAIIVKIVPVVPGFAVAGFTLLGLLMHRRATITAAAALGSAFAACSALPMLAAASVYARAGKLRMFLYANFGFGGAYVRDHPGVSEIAQKLATIVDSLWPLLALATVAAIALIRDFSRDRKLPPLLPLTVVWLGGELLAATASLHFFPHYFLSAVPPLAILAAYGIQALVGWTRVSERRGRAFALLAAIAALIPAERAQVDLLREMNRGRDQPRRVAALIKRASAGRVPTLFVTDYDFSVLYSLAQVPLPPTRFIITNFLFTGQSVMAKAYPEVEVARVLASRPDFILTDDKDVLPHWATLQLAAVLDRYRIIYREAGVTVYQTAVSPRDV